jgi:hypothetical protein
MPIFMRTDSDQIVHEVWAQEQANSCAVASIWMARNQALQKDVNEEEWALAWRTYYQVVKGRKLIPAPPAPVSLDQAMFDDDQKSFGGMFANAGTLMDQVATALSNDGLHILFKTPWTDGSAVLDKGMLSDTAPAVVLLGWYDASNKRKGGHFIVASRVASSGQIVFLDPWRGKLKELGAGPAYPLGGKFEQIVYISA